jgi:hypothetical protein
VNLQAELQAIYEARGVLTPEIVVEVARERKHPLHAKVFALAPKDAAEAWYRHQAYQLIRSVKIVYKEGDEGPVSTRAFVAVPRQDREFTYRPAEEVATDPFMRQLVLRRMEREWRAFQRRYSHFAEFAEMIAASLEENAA